MEAPLPNHLKSLAKLLEREDPKVLVFVGTGVSIGATSAPQASWLGLLKHGVNYLVDKRKFTIEYGDELKADLDAAFSPFSLDKALEHAENVQHNLSILKPEEFADWLYTSFSDLRRQIGKTGTLDAIRELQQAGALILTTNYDNLLSETTGLPPITWNNPTEFLKAYHEKNGILHIHGHWQSPDSIILGKRSYDRIVGEEAIQSLLKALWLDWTWIYVGCGDGIDDPNLGLLLSWGRQWDNSALKHYFLAKSNQAAALESRLDKLKNLVGVSFEEYSDLPKILHSITPAARCFPFTLIDEQFRLFRDPNSSPLVDPFPSRQEYLDGKVPKLEVDEVVIDRLNEHGWAAVLDVASVGKTTLALRLATSAEQRKHPVYYLDFANVDIENFGEDITSTLTRLSKQNVLLIFDNSHYQPELVRQLWDQWRDNPRGSKLLLIATQTQRHIKISPAQDLVFFESHIVNPAIELSPSENDLKNILNRIYFRVTKTRVTKSQKTTTTELNPPLSYLREWHKDYGRALGAFCLAVLSRLANFENGNWELPLSAASDWVKDKWLNKLDDEYVENLICLAVFGHQDLELNVYKAVLPYPEKTQLLMEKGLVTRINVGRLGQYQLYSLREPGWGHLILATNNQPINEETILFTSASRDPQMLVSLSLRLISKNVTVFDNLWRFIREHPINILKQQDITPIRALANLFRYARIGKQVQLSDELWKSIESNPQRFAERAWDTSLEHVGRFLTVAKSQERNVEPLWEAIESDPQRLAERAWDTSLERLGSFLTVAKSQERNVEPLWEAIESNPQRFAERAWDTSLHYVASFLAVANSQKRNVEPLWEAIESDPQRLAECAWDTSLEHVGRFLTVAKSQERNVEPLWEAIESNPQRLAERAWDTSLEHVGRFLTVAKSQERNVEPLWEAIESNPQRLAECAWDTSLEHVGRFLTVAKSQKRNVEPLWEAIESNPQRFAERAWDTSLEHVGRFLTVAKSQERNLEPLWEAIESDPQRFAERAWKTSLGHIGGFLAVAKSQKRNVEPLCEAIERQPIKLSNKAKNSQMIDLSGFCRQAPDSLARILLSEITPSHWDQIADAKPLLGGTGLAVRCAEIGREDLKSAIITKLLTRRNWHDFPLHSLPSLVWLLSNLSSTDMVLLPSFLNSICTQKWLYWQYTQSHCGSLALGLRMLAIFQPKEIQRRFHNSGIRKRLAEELSRFSLVSSQEQSEIIQLLASVNLFGLSIEKELLKNVPSDVVCDLSINVLPHREGASKVEEWQYQLWLGLHTYTSITKKSLQFSNTVIAKTLELWQSNLLESSVNPNSAEHRINEEMVMWLDEYLKQGTGLLRPPRNRLLQSKILP